MKNRGAILLILLMITTLNAQKNKIKLLVGTYTNSCDSKGIYGYEFDTTTGDFTFKNSSEMIINPSFLSISKDNKYVYSVSENGKLSSVNAFEFDSDKGQLHFLNSENSKGENSCYIINDDKNVITANYSGGSISVFGKNKDGSVTAVKQVIEHSGNGPNTKRQEKSHVHMVYFSPDKEYVLVNDLGNDNVYSYKYTPNNPKKVLKFKSKIAAEAGSGPRHLTFSKDGKLVYVLHELNASITTFTYSNGKLKKTDSISIIDKDFKGTFGAADIHLSPDGAFLYATNRGEANTISIFKIGKKGKLELVDHTSSLGKGPRNFVIDPTGNFLLVGHQYSNQIVIFKINKMTGLLTDTSKRIDLCSPVCLVFEN